MTLGTRESKISSAFIKLADTLVDDFDVVTLLHWLLEECTEILDTQAGGLMLVDAAGELQLIASTSEDANLVEVIQLAAGDGPCLECFRNGQAVTVSDLETEGARWPQFSEEALRIGFRSVHSTPLRLRGQTIGAMNLFSYHVGALAPDDVEVAQALADVATIGILQERSIRTAQMLADQLQHALDSRILIEQAKGVIAATLKTTVPNAFTILRTYARDRNLPLRQVADDVVSRRLQL
ncbi:transcriptional regulator with GAF, ATPase, and Fis domain [Leifsonia sp. AK011]|uniref:GAF and ANTAR domain-containing protein n=1 Tax=Leifsonia sp. AK011 TaxID=2723075 RepID=UPI0015CD28F4|nr:GAF and ANTAR domain-containing protein [Leifsonia sp. AK011]NYF09017.1 transcriptional regulator with GAF, ATPase, and Fis domain [Leifsonia sp. AK011]